MKALSRVVALSSFLCLLTLNISLAKPNDKPSCVFPPPESPQVQASGIMRYTNQMPQSSALPGVSSSPTRIIPQYWQTFPSGKNNAITDVPGVQVGQLSLQSDNPKVIRTGITAIVPQSHKGNLANTNYPAAGSILNGNGEVTGLAGLNYFGLLNGPILLTSTAAVGAVHQGIWQYFETHYPKQWTSELPVVAECWDGFFSTLDSSLIQPQDASTAIQQAQAGPVLQGRFGAGTGMRSFEMHAGIGSASRQIKLGNRDYTIGVLVNSNHSRLTNLNPLLKQALETAWHRPIETVQALDVKDHHALKQPQAQHQGSIIVVIATDLPLDAHSLKEVANHAGLGIAQMGGHMAITSGDFAIAFSTANEIQLGEGPKHKPWSIVSQDAIHPEQLSPVYQATVEAVVEAQLNALVASHHELLAPAP